MAEMDKSQAEFGGSVDDSLAIKKNEINKSHLKCDDNDSDSAVESVVGSVGASVVHSLNFKEAKLGKTPINSDDGKNNHFDNKNTKDVAELQSSLEVTPTKSHKEKTKDQSPQVTVISDDKSNNILISDCEEKTNHDSDDGMMSEIEQARQFIADSKTLNGIHKTPIKQNNFNRKRSDDSPPVTPGKCKRAKLITLASPKTKKVDKDNDNPLLRDPNSLKL